MFGKRAGDHAAEFAAAHTALNHLRTGRRRASREEAAGEQGPGFQGFHAQGGPPRSYEGRFLGKPFTPDELIATVDELLPRVQHSSGSVV